jgi:hypothetical protein
MTQIVMSFVAKIDPRRLTELRRLLSGLAADPGRNRFVPFGQNPNLHFSSMVIFDRPGIDPTLVWENNFDGDLESYVTDQLRIATDGLNLIFQCCLGYGGPVRLREFLIKCAVPAGLYHIGSVGRAVGRIQGEACLRTALQSRLTMAREATAVDCAAALREHVRADPKLAWALNAEPAQPADDQIKAWTRLILLATGTLLLSPILLPVALVILLIIRAKEKTDFEDHAPIPPAHLAALLAEEDLTANNHMASITRVKPGAVRLLVLRVILWAGNILVRVENKGTLGGIPGIHYAHWSLIDNGKWLLFLTNYTGSWTGYLDDFIERASRGLTAIWSNTGGFPRSRWLVGGGAKDGPLFKTYARNNQSETLVWYCAYPSVTLENVNENTAIRNGISADPDSEEAQRTWLRRI